MCRGNPAHGRGAHRDRHDAGRTAVDVGHVGAIRLCGRATVNKTIAQTTGVISRTAKSCGPGARVCASRLVVMREAQPASRIGDPRDDGE